MKRRLLKLGIGFSCCICSVVGIAQQETQPPDRLKVTIDMSHTAEPVSKYEFGMFIEHIRSLIYRSLWSEVLDDRKFYFPISKSEPAPAAPGDGSYRNTPLRK